MFGSSVTEGALYLILRVGPFRAALDCEWVESLGAISEDRGDQSPALRLSLIKLLNTDAPLAPTKRPREAWTGQEGELIYLRSKSVALEVDRVEAIVPLRDAVLLSLPALSRVRVPLFSGVLCDAKRELTPILDLPALLEALQQEEAEGEEAGFEGRAAELGPPPSAPDLLGDFALEKASLEEGEQTRLLIVEVEGRRFGLPLGNTLGVIEPKITPLPGCLPEQLGLAIHDGSLFPVLALSRLLRIASGSTVEACGERATGRSEFSGAGVLVLSEVAGEGIALHCDSVHGSVMASSQPGALAGGAADDPAREGWQGPRAPPLVSINLIHLLEASQGLLR